LKYIHIYIIYGFNMIIGTVQFVVSYQFNNISVVYIFLNDDYKLKHLNIEKIIVDHRVKVNCFLISQE
jgi:hypothetical protein